MNRPPSDHSGDEPDRDAWLSEALRHAPDADAAPSVAVRETILRQARAQAAAAPKPARPASAWQRFNAAWSWLSGPRVAAGFASVMVATVVGLMWWDRPIDEALRPVEPPATVAAPEAAPAPTQTPTPTPVPAPTSPAAPAAEPPAATSAAPGVEPPRDLAAKAPPPVALERKHEAKQRADTSNDARSEVAGAAAPAAPAAKRAADEARAQADATESARTEKETREVDATRERRAEAAQAKAAAAPALRSAPTAAAGAAGSLYAPAPAQASPPAATAPLRQARPAPLGALLEALSEESPRWRWQRDGGGERPWSPDMQAWMQRLDRTTAGRWSSADAGQGSERAPAQQLRVLRDGGLQATVRLGADDTVRIDIAGESPLVAKLPAASAAALQRALDDATR